MRKSVKIVQKITAFLIICLSLYFPSSMVNARGMEKQPGNDVSQQGIIETVLLTPKDRTRINLARPTFSWTSIAGATGYKIEISKSPDFFGRVYTYTVTENEFTPTFNLPQNVTMYWHVRPIGVRPSIYSTVFQFQTATPPEAPLLEKPKNKSLVDSLTPILIWEAVNHAVKYQIQFATNDVFDTDVVNIESISTLYMFQKPLENDRTFFWRIRTVDGDGDISIWSSTSSFRTKMEPPQLVSPANHEDVQTTRPTFTWLPVAGAKSYTLYISLDDTFTETTRYFTTVDPSFTPKEDLARDYTIYWRVVANGYNPSVSTTFDFAGANPPSTPVLIAPANSSLQDTSTPRFVWSSVNRAVKYQIQVASDNEFTTNLTSYEIENDKNGPAITMDHSLTGNTFWYWRVRSISENGDTSLWTTPRMFRTRMNPPVIGSSSNAGSSQPTFSWTGVEGATSYTIQISADSKFASYISKTLNGSTFTYSGQLRSGINYYIRVKANGTNPSLWSETVQFTAP